jgi:hypothetical protein
MFSAGILLLGITIAAFVYLDQFLTEGKPKKKERINVKENKNSG